MITYAIIHKDENYLINTIVWDGNTEFAISNDWIVVPLKDIDLSTLSEKPEQ